MAARSSGASCGSSCRVMPCPAPSCAACCSSTAPTVYWLTASSACTLASGANPASQQAQLRFHRAGLRPVRPRARMNARTVAIGQQAAPEAHGVVVQERAPVLARLRDATGVPLDQHLPGKRVQQFALVLEVPIERGLLHAQALGQAARAQAVHADLVEQVQRGADHGFAAEFGHAASSVSTHPPARMPLCVRAGGWVRSLKFQA